VGRVRVVGILALLAHPTEGQGLSHLAGRIILASMSALLSPVQDDKIWRVKIVWPNRHVHHFGKFTSEQDAIDWINAHTRLTEPLAEQQES
jgi:hypothetical protein